MKRILVHREGQSGHFFLALLEKFDTSTIRFRIPDQYQSKIFNLEITHEVNWQKHSSCYDQVLRILPERKIYHGIYNNFMKKLIVEQSTQNFQDWKNNIVHWYDTCFCNIQEYHNLITQDIADNQYTNIINFDSMLEDDYMDSVLKKYFGQELDADRRKILHRYRSLQLQTDLDLPHTDMQDIVGQLEHRDFDENPWFFAYCVFKYEKNNGLSESDRQWSVNDITQVQHKDNLLNLAQCYEFDLHKK